MSHLRVEAVQKPLHFHAISYRGHLNIKYFIDFNPFQCHACHVFSESSLMRGMVHTRQCILRHAHVYMLYSIFKKNYIYIKITKTHILFGSRKTMFIYGCDLDEDQSTF